MSSPENVIIYLLTPVLVGSFVVHKTHLELRSKQKKRCGISWTPEVDGGTLKIDNKRPKMALYSLSSVIQDSGSPEMPNRFEKDVVYILHSSEECKQHFFVFFFKKNFFQKKLGSQGFRSVSPVKVVGKMNEGK